MFSIRNMQILILRQKAKSWRCV